MDAAAHPTTHSAPITRRHFVATSGVGALGASALGASSLGAVPPGSAAPADHPAPSHGASAPAAGRVDVHHHAVPPEWRQALQRIGQDKSGGSPIPAWDEGATLALMDRRGIAAAVASVSAPGVYFEQPGAGVGLARELARACNEFVAGLARRHPARFGALGILPLPDVPAAVAEVAHAYDRLAVDGVLLQASYGRQYLGDPQFDPVMAALDARRAVVLLHPTTPPGSEVAQLGVPGTPMPPFVAEFAFDTTRAVANLLVNGAFERYPNVRWILAHAGGTVPYLVQRFALGGRLEPKLRARAPREAVDYLRALHYDTAIASTPHTLASLLKLVPATQVLFGSDHPYLAEPLIAEEQAGVAGYRGLDAAARAAVERENARRLFPGLARRMGAA